MKRPRADDWDVIEYISFPTGSASPLCEINPEAAQELQKPFPMGFDIRTPEQRAKDDAEWAAVVAQYKAAHAAQEKAAKRRTRRRVATPAKKRRKKTE